MDAIKKLLSCEKRLKIARGDYEEAIVQAQLTCKHPQIVEGEYEPSNPVSNGFAPFRVCRECGYAEEGWGAGYSFLTKGYEKDSLEIPTVDRNIAYQFRRGATLDNEEHRAVLNGERKLEEVLRNR